MRTEIYELKNNLITAELLYDKNKKTEVQNKIKEEHERIKEIAKMYLKNNSNVDGIKNIFKKALENNQLKEEEIIVKNIKEAINKIEEIDFRQFLGLNVKFRKTFNLDLDISPKVVSFAVSSEVETKKQIDELKNMYRNSNIVIVCNRQVLLEKFRKFFIPKFFHLIIK